MSAKKVKLLIPAIGTAVVVAGGVAAYMHFNGAFEDVSSPLASASVVPSEAMIAAFISTDEQPWLKLRQFGTPEAQNFLEKSLQELNQRMIAESKISYDKDIKPWVGGLMIAVLPPMSSNTAQFINVSQPTSQPNILMVVGIKDKLGALNFANKLKSEKGVKSQESDYKGEKITESILKGEPIYSAVLKNQLVLAAQRKAVEQAIDTFKGGNSFVSIDGAKSILTQGADVKNSFAQIYVPDYADTVEQIVSSSPNAKLPPETLAQLRQVKSVVAGVGVDDAGIRMKAIATLAPQVNQLDYQPAVGKVVARFPSETIALVSGQGISRSWNSIVEQTKTSPSLGQALDQVRQQLQIFNFDLDKDIFGWMDGEFALAAIPSNQGLLAAVGFGGAIVIETSDRKTALSTLSKLDNLARGYSVGVNQRQVQGKTVTEWQIPLQGAMLGHGWLDEKTMFVALGGPMSDAIVVSPSQTLDRSEAFKAATGSLQKPNAGYFYLDMDKTMSIARRVLPTSNGAIPHESTALLDSIRGVGMTATSPSKSTTQMEVLLALKPRMK